VRYCQCHWDALRAAVDVRGLGHLVAQSGDEALANTALELKGAGETFDPLMGAHWRIANRVIENLGRTQGPDAAISAIGDPEWCPLCAVQASFDWWEDRSKNTSGDPRPAHALDAQGWVDATLDSALAYAREQRLPGVPA
jgi:hypothetical protein